MQAEKYFDCSGFDTTKVYESKELEEEVRRLMYDYLYSLHVGLAGAVLGEDLMLYVVGYDGGFPHVTIELGVDLVSNTISDCDFKSSMVFDVLGNYKDCRLSGESAYDPERYMRLSELKNSEYRRMYEETYANEECVC